jgi:hypothetical protein
VSVVVQFHERCGPELDRWVESLPGPAADRRRFARQYLAALRHLLIEARGEPADAAPVPGTRPPAYRLHLGRGWHLRFIIRDERSGGGSARPAGG